MEYLNAINEISYAADKTIDAGNTASTECSYYQKNNTIYNVIY